MPTNALDHTLAVIGAATKLSEEMQERIVDYALARRKTEILTTLAAREDLREDLSERLLEHGDAKVTAERAKVMIRLGRIDDVTRLLKKEKRVTVTKGIAEAEGLPAEIYRAVLATKRQTALLAIARNQSIEDAIREEAVVQILAEGFYNYPRNLQPAMLSLPGVAARVLETNRDPQVWKFLLDSCPCTSADRNRIAELLTEWCKQGLNATAKEHTHLLGSYDNELWTYMAVAGALASRPIDTERAELLASALEALADNVVKGGTASHLPARLKSVAGDLRNAKSGEDLTTRLKRATSSKDVHQALDAFKSTTLTLAEMRALLESPWFGPEHWRSIQHHWHQAQSLIGILGEARPAAIAYLRVRVGWFGGLDDLLAKCTNPGEKLLDLIALERNWRIGLAPEILSSRYLTTEHVKAMSLSMLAGGVSEETAELVSELVSEATADRDAWDALVGIGSEFDGTIAELLETSGKL